MRGHYLPGANWSSKDEVSQRRHTLTLSAWRHDEPWPYVKEQQ